MNCLSLPGLILLSVVAQTPATRANSGPTKDQEVFNQAKILMFEQKWEDARQVFQRMIREFPQSNLLPQAYYHSAYCLQLQKKPEETVAAYDQFLQKYPKEPDYARQARQNIVHLSATLFEQGKTAYRSRLVSALTDPDKDVRYLAAIRAGSLKDRQLDPLCVPVLKEIVTKEKQLDLVAPATIALLRIDPAALAKPAPAKPATTRPEKAAPKPGSTEGRQFHIQIFENGEQKPPSVELNFPMAFAQLAVMALDEATKVELRKNGFDIDNIWQSLNRLGPTHILTLRSGPRVVKIWIQ